MPDSELIREIITSPSAARLLEYVSDVYGDGYVALWLFEVIGQEVDDLERWTDEIRLQIFPQTATWGIILWEQLYKLYPSSDATLEQRRRNVLLHRQARAPINPSHLKNVVEKISGLSAAVIENVSKNCFEIRLYGFALPSIRDAIRKTVDRDKQAHLIWYLCESMRIYLINQNHISAQLSINASLSPINKRPNAYWNGAHKWNGEIAWSSFDKNNPYYIPATMILNASLSLIHKSTGIVAIRLNQVNAAKTLELVRLRLNHVTHNSLTSIKAYRFSMHNPTSSKAQLIIYKQFTWNGAMKWDGHLQWSGTKAVYDL